MSMKMELLEEILEHLSHMQGKGLKGKLDESKHKMPHGVEIESIEMMPKKEEEGEGGLKEAIKAMDKKPDNESPEGSEDEMTEEELNELLSKYLK